MRSLLLSDLRLGLSELLDDKAARLDETHAGRLYAPRLASKRDAIEALPEPTVAEGRPLAEELAETDGEHDGFGAAIWHYTEAVRLAPGMSEEVREAARGVRETFIPELALIGRSYATEAAHALGKRERIAEHKDALGRLPIPGNNKTLRVWVEGFVTCGENLEALLRARAQQQAATVGERGRREAGTLRVDTIGLLGRLRAALADELADEPEQLAALDAELFGYFDQLAADREASLRRRTTAASAPAPAAEPTPTAEPVDPATVA